ncbi:holin lysis mediator [Shewanella phage Thanatos-1]|nr:holin lysis mediator [Shewanella phage Thanatos-1]
MTPKMLPVDLVMGVLGFIFKDNASGRILFSRVGVIVVFFVLALIWYKGDYIMETYKESSYSNYSEMLQKERNAKFETAALEQLQIVHVSSGADFSAVYSFRPKNLNYFVDLIAYEGRLPSTVNEKNLGGFPVDKTSREYTVHLSGRNFWTETEFIFLPTKKDSSELKFMFSCPYFNLENIYAGTISMYWYEKPHMAKDIDRLTSICSQGTRTLGRSR